MPTVRASISAIFHTERRSSSSGGSVSEKAAFGDRSTYVQGTGDGEVDEKWDDLGRSVAAAANDDIDLQSLTQTDDDGNTVRSSISFSKVKGLYIENTTKPSVGGHLVVGAAASNEWAGSGAPFENAGDQVRIPPGARWILESDEAWSVASARKVLRVSGVTATQTFNIGVVGTA